MTLQFDPGGLRMFVDEAFDVDGFDGRIILLDPSMTCEYWHHDVDRLCCSATVK